MSTQIIFIQVHKKIFIHPFASFRISVNFPVPYHATPIFSTRNATSCIAVEHWGWSGSINVVTCITVPQILGASKLNKIVWQLNYESHFVTFYYSLLNIWTTIFTSISVYNTALKRVIASISSCPVNLDTSYLRFQTMPGHVRCLKNYNLLMTFNPI